RELFVRGKRRSSARTTVPRARPQLCRARPPVPEMRVLQLPAAPGSYFDNPAAANLPGRLSGPPGWWQKLRHMRHSRRAMRRTSRSALSFLRLIFLARTRERQDVFSNGLPAFVEEQVVSTGDLNSAARSNAATAVYKCIAFSATCGTPIL